MPPLAPQLALPLAPQLALLLAPLVAPLLAQLLPTLVALLPAPVLSQLQRALMTPRSHVERPQNSWCWKGVAGSHQKRSSAPSATSAPSAAAQTALRQSLQQSRRRHLPCTSTSTQPPLLRLAATCCVLSLHARST